MASASIASPSLNNTIQFSNITMSQSAIPSTNSTPTQPSTAIFQPYTANEYQLQQQQQSVIHERSLSSSSISSNSFPIPPGFASRPRVTTTLWDDEGTLCYQVEAKGVQVARREDNDMINGTKLLNLAGMTRGRRDGILKTEKVRHVVKVGAMHLKGVWIPYERALEFAQKAKIDDMLYPLFLKDLKSWMYYPTADLPRSLPPSSVESEDGGSSDGSIVPKTVDHNTDHHHSQSISSTSNEYSFKYEDTSGQSSPPQQQQPLVPSPPQQPQPVHHHNGQSYNYDYRIPHQQQQQQPLPLPQHNQQQQQQQSMPPPQVLQQQQQHQQQQAAAAAAMAAMYYQPPPPFNAYDTTQSIAPPPPVYSYSTGAPLSRSHSPINPDSQQQNGSLDSNTADSTEQRHDDMHRPQLKRIRSD